MTKSLRGVVLGAGGICGFLLLWELLRWSGAISTRDFGFPSTIVEALPAVLASRDFGEAARLSAYQFLIGGTIGVIAGLVWAVLCGLYTRVGLACELLLTAGYAVPMIGLVPILVLTLGIGNATAITIVAIFTFFPVYFIVNGTVKSVDAKLTRMCRAFGGRDLDVVTGIVLPSIVPAIVSGTRLGLGRGLMGLVVTELYLGTTGLGSYILNNISQGAQGPAFVAIATIALVNLGMTEAMGGIEKRLERWRPQLT